MSELFEKEVGTLEEETFNKVRNIVCGRSRLTVVSYKTVIFVLLFINCIFQMNKCELIFAPLCIYGGSCS